MAFQPCTGIAQFNLQYLYDSQVMENVYHVDNLLGTQWTQAQLLAQEQRLGAWDLAKLVPLRNAKIVLTNIRSRDLTVQAGQERDDTYNQPGTNTSDPMPANVTIAVQWQSGLSGRSNRGRTFHIGLTEAQVTDNSIGSSTQTAITQAYLDIINGTHQPPIGLHVILSRQLNKAKRPVGIGVAIAGVALTDPVVDSQRRRLPFHNRHR